MIKYLLLASLICFTACSYNDGNEVKLNKANNSGLCGNPVYVKEIIYNNHSYLEFKENYISGQGWVHNPDCSCYKEIYE